MRFPSTPRSCPGQARPFAKKAEVPDGDAMTVEIPVPFEAHRIDPPSQFVETSKTEIVK